MYAAASTHQQHWETCLISSHRWSTIAWPSNIFDALLSLKTIIAVYSLSWPHKRESG